MSDDFDEEPVRSRTSRKLLSGATNRGGASRSPMDVRHHAPAVRRALVRCVRPLPVVAPNGRILMALPPRACSQRANSFGWNAESRNCWRSCRATRLPACPERRRSVRRARPSGRHLSRLPLTGEVDDETAISRNRDVAVGDGHVEYSRQCRNSHPPNHRGWRSRGRFEHPASRGGRCADENRTATIQADGRRATGGAPPTCRAFGYIDSPSSARRTSPYRHAPVRRTLRWRRTWSNITCRVPRGHGPRALDNASGQPVPTANAPSHDRRDTRLRAH